MKKQPSCVVIGGGTGTFSVLSGLKNYTQNITAIVTMADSGGSAKKERDELGLLPSSDVRKCLIALADVSQEDSLLLRQLFQYRYSQGVGLSGMTFGNLFLVALTKLLGSQKAAIEKAAKLLRIRGNVLPVTYKQVDLVATYADGSVVTGEHNIDEPRHDGTLRIVKLATRPRAHITPEASTAMKEADIIIFAPGGFYTSILAALAITGVTDAIRKSRAKKVFIMNLMTEYGQTYGFTAKTFIEEFSTFIPQRYLDVVLVNTAPIPETILTRYKTFHAEPVLNDLGKRSFSVFATDLLSDVRVKREKGDTLKRSFVRHSPEKVAAACLRALNLL